MTPTERADRKGESMSSATLFVLAANVRQRAVWLHWWAATLRDFKGRPDLAAVMEEMSKRKHDLANELAARARLVLNAEVEDWTWR